MKHLPAALALFSSCVVAAAGGARPPGDEAELRRWLENMVWHHGFSAAEVGAATGMAEDEVGAALGRLAISADTKPARRAGEPLLVLPYPGGRHPRVGFLDGAVDPQRETKASVFTPWDASSYVVVDVPEAVWSNLGLTYLAHTHVDTIWTKRGVELPQQEWERGAGGRLSMQRALPNGIRFGAKLEPLARSVAMEMWLRNGTAEPLTDLRVQMCVMLKGAKGFDGQTGDNKVLRAPYAACRDAGGKRWIITAWEPCHRPWQNPPVPCLHSDPKFPDCAPGATVRVRGRLWFYEGDDIAKELDRLDASGWRRRPAPDIREVEPDLVVPPLAEGAPAAGKRVAAAHPDYAGTDAHHVLYLPENWQPGGSYPVVVELAGNGPYKDARGDVSTGFVEGSNLGYGLSGGRDYIWLCLPYLNADATANVRGWWGDPPEHDPRPTVEYCKKTVPWVCREFGGDPERVVLCGFSRGAIACNFIGLHDDEIAGLWRGFMPFSHYDGVRKWGYPASDRKSALRRLERLRGRPQLVMAELSSGTSPNLEATRRYLGSLELEDGAFTFLDCGFGNHNDAWALRPCAARSAARDWLEALVALPPEPGLDRR